MKQSNIEFFFALSDADCVVIVTEENTLKVDSLIVILIYIYDFLVQTFVKVLLTEKVHCCLYSLCFFV